jgi:hypothetical protein
MASSPHLYTRSFWEGGVLDDERQFAQKSEFGRCMSQATTATWPTMSWFTPIAAWWVELCLLAALDEVILEKEHSEGMILMPLCACRLAVPDPPRRTRVVRCCAAWLVPALQIYYPARESK